LEQEGTEETEGSDCPSRPQPEIRALCFLCSLLFQTGRVRSPSPGHPQTYPRKTTRSFQSVVRKGRRGRKAASAYESLESTRISAAFRIRVIRVIRRQKIEFGGCATARLSSKTCSLFEVLNAELHTSPQPAGVAGVPVGRRRAGAQAEVNTIQGLWRFKASGRKPLRRRSRQPRNGSSIPTSFPHRS